MLRSHHDLPGHSIDRVSTTTNNSNTNMFALYSQCASHIIKHKYKKLLGSIQNVYFIHFCSMRQQQNKKYTASVCKPHACTLTDINIKFKITGKTL